MRETLEQKQKRIKSIIQILRKKYGKLKCFLTHSTPFELLAATILSAQCTDARVNKVTPALFKRYPKVKDYAKADLEELEELVRTTGFYKNKAKNIQGAAKALVKDHGGVVPDKLDALVKLPGVGRKTANVVLGNVFDIPGLTVDTHMIRLNRLLKLTSNTDPVKIERDLMKIVPQKEWTQYSHLIIFHGRERCPARRPNCSDCEIQNLCPSSKV